ncbi:MAG: ATP-binding protein [Candidatus Thorarchaeota archaeon]
MKIAVASGKGGTGKTAIAVSLATVASESCELFDCDVEAPNAAHFLREGIAETRVLAVPIPEIDHEVCTFCGACARICQFNALAVLSNDVMVFDILCHSCGACSIACPVPGALKEVSREIGVIRIGASKRSDVQIIDGLLNIGEPIASGLIRHVKAAGQGTELSIIDCPPGAACPVIEAIKGVDFVILVTEPTPFGIHDLRLALDLTEVLRIPRGVIINRDDPNTEKDELQALCREKNAPILLRIPFRREFAKQYAIGNLLIDVDSDLESKMRDMLNRIRKLIAKGDNHR